MAGKRTSGSRQSLIRCDNCGEEYSSTYRRCPFCDEYDEYESGYEDEDEYEDDAQPTPRGGGKRLTRSPRRGGGYRTTSPVRVISFVVSLVVILLAVWIVVAKVLPLVRRGDAVSIDLSASPSAQVSADAGTQGDDRSADQDAAPSDAPASSDAGTDVSDAPVSDAPAADGATQFSLSKSEFSFSDRYPDPVTLTVTFTPAGSTGTLTWSSSDPDVASVDSAGKVSRGAKSGVATITASLPGGVSHTCTVHNQVGSASQSGSSGSYTINNADFTLTRRGETYQLKVRGYTGGITWSSSNTSLVTVSADGTCTAVGTGAGHCTITAALDDGSKVTAIARISIS
jgi:hypothetical protein